VHGIISTKRRTFVVYVNSLINNEEDLMLEHIEDEAF
jgi:hypothetical protein